MLGKIIVAICALILVLFVGTGLYFSYVANPKITKELNSEPNGERAAKVMLLTLPSGKTIPVNYLREGEFVFVGADGRWWREFQHDGKRVEVFIRGEALEGNAVAMTEDPEYRDDIFERLRPTVPTWMPEYFKGVLVRIEIAPET